MKNICDESLKIVELFFAKTNSIISEYPRLMYYFDIKDKIQTYKLRFKEDRDTYIFCHTLLRLILSKKMKTDPSKLKIIIDTNCKPKLLGDHLFFNISRTKGAFAFAISEACSIGIDLERVWNINFKSIIGRFFSVAEQKYVLKSPDESHERFFYIWTRKEALLKAEGTGIVTDLACIEVLDQVNSVSSRYLENETDKKIVLEYSIHSERIMNYILSVAAPQKINVKINLIDTQVINSILSNE